MHGGSKDGGYLNGIVPLGRYSMHVSKCRTFDTEKLVDQLTGTLIARVS